MVLSRLEKSKDDDSSNIFNRYKLTILDSLDLKKINKRSKMHKSRIKAYE